MTPIASASIPPRPANNARARFARRFAPEAAEAHYLLPFCVIGAGLSGDSIVGDGLVSIRD
jgi:hypothetical protein